MEPALKELLGKLPPCQKRRSGFYSKRIANVLRLSDVRFIADFVKMF